MQHSKRVESTALIKTNNVERIRVNRPLAAGDFRISSRDTILVHVDDLEPEIVTDELIFALWHAP
jgi:hypothetical protein